VKDLKSDALAETLVTDRLLLRPLEHADAEALLNIFSDHEVMRFWNTPPWTSLSDSIRFIESSLAGMRRRESMTLGIVLKETTELIGKCMLFSIDSESRRAELGFGIARRHWGRGYTSEAARALLEHAFKTQRLRRIEAEIDPQNSSSRKTLERLGFQKEGHLRQRWEINGVVSDSALYGLLASDLGDKH